MQMFPYWVQVLTQGSISLEKRREHTLVVAAIGAQAPLVDIKGCSFQINTAMQARGQPVPWEGILKFKADFGSYSSIILQEMCVLPWRNLYYQWVMVVLG